MLKKIFSICIIIILIYGFLISPNFSELSAGVAVFLYGMIFLGDGFKSFTGGTLEKVLHKFSDKTWKGLLLGGISATLMQSSSLVSILTISFLSAELITLVQGIAIIFGANMGTTTGIWLMAAYGLKVNIATYAMPMLALGFVLNFQKKKSIKALGSILAGLGFLFLGIAYMKSGFEGFKENIDLMSYSMNGFLGVLVFTFIGILMTVLMQSSHATLILVITALGANQVTYENALALAIGANIGTTITAVIGSLNANINGKRLALSDVLFKSSTGFIFILFIYQITGLIDILSSVLGIGSEDYVLKIALFHTLFNVIGVIIIIPFIDKLVLLVKKIFSENSEKNLKNYDRNMYLSGASLDLPESSIIALTKESKRLFENALEVILDVLGLRKDDLKKGDYLKNEIMNRVNIYPDNIDEIYGRKIKILYGEIINFAAKAQVANGDTHYEDFRKLKFANIDIAESIKTLKHIQRNLKRYLNSKNKEIKKEYEKIVYDLLFVISNIYSLSTEKDNMQKMIYLAKIEKYIKDNNIVENGEINNLIKNTDIEDTITTSLIKDTNYKNKILTKILEAAEVIFNRKVLDKNIKKKNKFVFKNIFGITNKKFDKIIKKFENKKVYLKRKLSKSNDSKEKDILKQDIEIIDFIIDKYKN